MNSSQFRSIYLENLHMSAGKKAAGMPQHNISLMLNELLFLFKIPQLSLNIC
jgi:hypothetical protein